MNTKLFNMTNNNNPPFHFKKPTLTIEQIQQHSRDLLLRPKTDTNSMFIIKPASSWLQQAHNRPLQRMLFSEFWHESELCILFADTNLGKSILAVQIAESISRGGCINGFATPPPAQPVLYFDFELTDKQFENRYSLNYENHYPFNDNFLRIELNPDLELPEGADFEQYLTYCLESAIIEHKASVLIIDNLTYLRTEIEKAKDALPLMKHLKSLKTKHNLSLLVLAHTPKRDSTKPLSRNDLSGSKMLINFCDSAFAIGESHKDKNLRYLKQIKQRNTEQIYGGDNIALCQITKPLNFLQFDLIGYGKEYEHLKEHTEKDDTELIQQVARLHAEGLSLREIGKQLGISHGFAGKLVKRTKV